MRSASRVPDLPLDFAKLSFFDWMTCGIAGTNEPLAVKLRQLAAGEGGQPVASVLGGMRVPPRMALSMEQQAMLSIMMTHILPMLGICRSGFISRLGYRRDAGCFGRGNDHGLPPWCGRGDPRWDDPRPRALQSRLSSDGHCRSIWHWPGLLEGSSGSIVCRCVTRLAHARRGPLA